MGFEPTRTIIVQQILSLSRLPIPSSRLIKTITTFTSNNSITIKSIKTNQNRKINNQIL